LCSSEGRWPLSRELKLGVAVLFLAVVCLLVSRVLPEGPGARSAPSAAEVAVARRLRSWALPATLRESRNPLKTTQELLDEGARHFADHCASCHANDGSGATEMGRHLFPRVPDMRGEATQRLSDGELYYIIHNGVRWTGMPAWGDKDDDQDSWKLVLFVRHLSHLTPEEIRDMERFNPKSIAEREEEKQEEEFLNGGASSPTPTIHKLQKENSK
jgi:mono/diheme cytochrome c family protein